MRPRPGRKHVLRPARDPPLSVPPPPGFLPISDGWLCMFSIEGSCARSPAVALGCPWPPFPAPLPPDLQNQTRDAIPVPRRSRRGGHVALRSSAGWLCDVKSGPPQSTELLVNAVAANESRRSQGQVDPVSLT